MSYITAICPLITYGRNENRAPIEFNIRTTCHSIPAIGWSIALLVSAGLWWGIADAVSVLDFGSAVVALHSREGRLYLTVYGRRSNA